MKLLTNTVRHWLTNRRLRRHIAKHGDLTTIGRPLPGEVCPQCGSQNITASPKLPPMRCNDCGDRWAGRYQTQQKGHTPPREDTPPPTQGNTPPPPNTGGTHP
jgi:hypothetical protein